MITAIMLFGRRERRQRGEDPKHCEVYSIQGPLTVEPPHLSLQIPNPASDACEPEALPAPAPSQPAAPSTYLSSYYSTTPCLPPYTAYDLQVGARSTSRAPPLALHLSHSTSKTLALHLHLTLLRAILESMHWRQLYIYRHIYIFYLF